MKSRLSNLKSEIRFLKTEQFESEEERKTESLEDDMVHFLKNSKISIICSRDPKYQ
jgi:hypothetical protein